MNSILAGVVRLAIAVTTLSLATTASAGFGTTVPITAEVASNIARGLFPRTIALDNGSLFVSEPVVAYLTAGEPGAKRISLRVSLQTLQRQPDQSLVASAPGQAEVSGEIGYDNVTAQILLVNPRVDSLSFKALGAQKEAEVRTELLKEWNQKITNPMRVDVPNDPYLLPFKQGIKNVSMQDNGIVIEVWFE